MKTFHALLLVLGLVTAAHAQPLVVYEMTNNGTIPTTYSGVVGTAFSKGPLLPNAIANNNLFSVSVDNSATTPVTAVTNGQYFQFTISPPVGRTMTYQAIAFEAAKEAPNSTGRGWVVRGSLDGFASDLGTQPIVGPAPTFTDFVLGLPPATYTEVATSVTFRIYTYAAAPLEFVDYDNIQILATVDPLPTPTPVDLPPSVAFAGKKRFITTSGRVRLLGAASDDNTVTRVTVGNQQASGTGIWSSKVRLRPGLNRIAVFATDDAGQNSPTLKLRVTRKAP